MFFRHADNYLYSFFCYTALYRWQSTRFSGMQMIIYMFFTVMQMLIFMAAYALNL